MSALRGGIPHVVREAFDTTGRAVRLPFDILYLVARNKGANVGRIYFTQKDFEDGVNYVELPVAAATDPYGEWQGPVETITGSDHTDLYLQGIGGSATVELVVFQRRG